MLLDNIAVYEVAKMIEDIVVRKFLQIKLHLIRVLTLAAWISYNFLTASLICFLFAVSPTMKTKVLLSSIFFIADSVVRGNLMISYAFEVSPCLVRSGETFGFLANLSVLGLKK